MFNEFGFDGNLGFDTFEDPVSNPSINWNAIIQQAFALGSHAISAFSGQNTGTQIGYNPNQGGVFAIQPNIAAGGNVGNQPIYQTPEQLAYQRKQAGLLEDAGGGIMAFIEKYPIPIAGGVLALFLLFKDPPRSRR